MRYQKVKQPELPNKELNTSSHSSLMFSIERGVKARDISTVKTGITLYLKLLKQEQLKRAGDDSRQLWNHFLGEVIKEKKL